MALLGLGAALAFAALGSLVPPPPPRGHAAPPGRLRPSLLATALLASAGSLVLFPRANPLAWACWLLSLVLAGLAFPRARSAARPLPRPERLLLAGCLLLAAGLRLWHVTEAPYGVFADEATNLEDAREAPTSAFLGHPQLPALFYLLVELAARAVGRDILATRLVTAALGTAAVAAAFAAGRLLHGARFGLLFAFVVAVSRWPLTFSRNGFVIGSGLFTAALAVAALLKARRTAVPRDQLLAGFALGLAATLYFSGRLVFLPAALFAAASCWRRPRAAPFARVALGLALTVAPVAQFALRDPGSFLARTSQVSIFGQRDEPDLAKALWSNFRKHALMLHVSGDGNGRHNVPPEPMLDLGSGALLALGLGAALRRIRRPDVLLLVTLWPAGMLGGVLTMDWEAPQAARTVAAVPAILYLVALGAFALARAASPLGLPAARAAAGALLLFLIARWNVGSYFHAQDSSPPVFWTHDGEQSVAGRAVGALRTDATVWATLFLRGHPSFRLLSGNRPVELVASRADLPLRTDPTRGAVIVVDPNETWVLERAPRFYPHARTLVRRGPDERTITAIVLVPRVDVAAAAGLELRLIGADGRESVSPVSAIRGALSPLPSLPSRAEWRGLVALPAFGTWSLRLAGTRNPSVRVDGAELSAPVVLAAGLHDLRVTASLAEGSAPLLFWSRPGASDPNDAREAPVPATVLFRSPPVRREGLRAELFPNESLSPPAALVRIDPELDEYYQEIPMPRPYSVRWTGTLAATAEGGYGFGLRATGKARLTVDGRDVVSVEGKDRTARGTARLAAGPHRIVVTFVDDQSYSRLHLSWTRPGAAEEIVPSSALTPD